MEKTLVQRGTKWWNGRVDGKMEDLMVRRRFEW